MRKLLFLLISFLFLGSTASFARPAALSAKEGSIAARISKAVSEQETPSAFEKMISSVKESGITTVADITAAIRELEGANTERRTKYLSMFSEEINYSLRKVKGVDAFQIDYLLFLMQANPDLNGYCDAQGTCHETPLFDSVEEIKSQLVQADLQQTGYIHPWRYYAAFFWLKHNRQVLADNPELKRDIYRGIALFNSILEGNPKAGTWSLLMQKAIGQEMEAFLDEDCGPVAVVVGHRSKHHAAPDNGVGGEKCSSGNGDGGYGVETRTSVVGGITPYRPL